MYFSQSAQFQHCFFVQVVKHTKCIYHENSPKKRKKTEKFPPFFEKIIDNLQINYLRLVLEIKKDNLIYIHPRQRVGYIPEYVSLNNILGFQLPFFLYYDYGLNAFNCQAICYYSIFGLAFFILQVNTEPKDIRMILLL
jgi:hypothetical protein